MDCVAGAREHIADNTIDLIICDPPFGIQESTFKNQYNRDHKNILSGYEEAPVDYYKFSLEWISEAKRVMKEDGSLYIISGWSNLNDILSAIKHLDMKLINHIIWKYQFGVNCTKKFISSHYHILYIGKNKKSTPAFYTNCRFAQEDKTSNGGCARYADMEDVWIISKEYKRGAIKNCNKLPEALIQKIMEYSSKENDLVCDFFLGIFTTATVAKKLNRRCTGFELNKIAYDYFMNNK